MVMLTKEERVRFAAWLRQEAASNDALATQADKMDGLGFIVKQYRQKVLAATIMAVELDKIEDQTI